MKDKAKAEAQQRIREEIDELRDASRRLQHGRSKLTATHASVRVRLKR